MLGYPPAEGERFWHHFESSGWIDKNGHPIVKWESKLATWIADARAKPAETAHHRGNKPANNAGNGTISASMQAMLDSKNLERIEKRMADIRNSVEGLQTMDECERDELRELKKKARAIKQTLGIIV